MAKKQNSPLLIMTSIISSIFGLIIIILTVYHEITVKQKLSEINESQSDS